jgi:hypothetical protein
MACAVAASWRRRFWHMRASSAASAPPNKLSEACGIVGHALFACGPFFTDRNEQALVLQLLSSVEKEYGWPTETVVSALVEEWKGEV